MEMQPPGDITQLLLDWGKGKQEAFDKLMELVYNELRRIARWQFQKLGRGGLLQPTAVVHEAYIKLIDQSRIEWKNRAHFYGIAAKTIRRIIVDDYRKRSADKRGGKQGLHVPISEADASTAMPEVDFIALNQALDALEAVDERQARIVELRFFVGLDYEETARLLGISHSSVEREWRCAKAWLHFRLNGAER